MLHVRLYARRTGVTGAPRGPALINTTTTIICACAAIRGVSRTVGSLRLGPAFAKRTTVEICWKRPYFF